MILLKKDKALVDILISVFAFTMPFGLIHNINPISIILLTVFTMFLSIKNRSKSFKSIEITKLSVLPLIFFFFLVFTLIYSENLTESIKQLEKNLSFLLFPVIFYELNGHFTKKTKGRVVFSFVLGNIIALFICLFYAVYIFDLESNTDPLFKGSFYFTDLLDFHPTYFSMYLILCISFIRTYINENKTKIKPVFKAILIILIVFICVSIVHLRSRSGILALVLIEVVLFFSLFFKKYAKVNKIVFWLVFASFVTFLMFLTIKGKVNDYGKEYFKRDTHAAVDNRLKNWKASLDAFSEAPFLGNGLYDSGKIRDKYFYINGYDIGIDKNYNSHNQFIETLMIGGVLGLAILLLMLFNLLVFFIKNKKKPVLSFFILLLIVMMTESILVRQHGIVFFSFFYVFFYTNLNED